MIVTKNISDIIGKTPVLAIPLAENTSTIFLKLEVFNPCGSMKDRMAKNMFLNAIEDAGITTIVESSSGNTASALAMMCAENNKTFKAVVDNHASRDKINTIKAFGGHIIKVGDESNQLATLVRDTQAEQIGNEIGHFWTAQHDNNYNAIAYEELAEELIEQIPELDYFISAIGTGGSVCGTSFFLKQHFPNLKTIGVEPEGNVIFGGEPHDYHQSGTGTPAGANIGIVIDYSLIDYGFKVSDKEAFNTCIALANRKGVLVGGSTGGSLYKAFKFANEYAEGNINVITLACDSGFKYLDTIYNKDWMIENKLWDEKIQHEINGIIS